MPIWTRWKSKPWPGTPIDRTHPLAQGMAACWVFNEGSGTPIELAGNGLLSSSANLTWASGPDGSTGTFGGSTDLAYSGIPAIGGKGMTVAFAVTMPVVAANQMFVERETVNGTWQAFTEGASDIKFRGGSAGNRFLSAGGVLHNNTWHTIVLADNGSATSNSANTACYLDGVALANSGSDSSPPVANSNIVHLGNYDNSSYYLVGQLSWVYLYDHALTAPEALSLSADPWQVFAPPTAYWLMKAAAAGGPSFQPWIYGDQIGEMYG